MVTIGTQLVSIVTHCHPSFPCPPWNLGLKKEMRVASEPVRPTRGGDLGSALPALPETREEPRETEGINHELEKPMPR